MGRGGVHPVHRDRWKSTTRRSYGGLSQRSRTEPLVRRATVRALPFADSKCADQWCVMDKLHFPAREVPPYGEYATADTLLAGHTYFRLGYVDKQMRIPELTPLVYIGRNLAENGTDALYFQDAARYLAGIRFGDANEGDYHTVDAGT